LVRWGEDGYPTGGDRGARTTGAEGSKTMAPAVAERSAEGPGAEHESEAIPIAVVAVTTRILRTWTPWASLI
jgi:hypothetical protein